MELLGLLFFWLQSLIFLMSASIFYFTSHALPGGASGQATFMILVGASHQHDEEQEQEQEGAVRGRASGRTRIATRTFCSPPAASFSVASVVA